MQVAFDGQPIVSKQFAGIGVYTNQIIASLIKNYPQELFYINVFANSKHNHNLDYVRSLSSDNCSVIESNFNNSNRLKKLILWSIKYPYRRHFPESTDIIHFFNNTLPFGFTGRSITTIHDMVYKVLPETMHPYTRAVVNLTLKNSANRADRILTVSESSKRDIVRFLHVDPDKIFIAPSAANSDIYHNRYPESTVNLCRQKYGLDKQYFLYTGTLEPRKNISRLVQAYGLAFQADKTPPSLVICGKNGWMFEDIYKQVEQLGPLKDNVLFTGYIPTEDIALLMNGALSFVFPTLYEGFGTPPLEAMACGAPVITSNTSSLPEVVGNAAVLINPYSVNELAEALKACSEDSLMLQKMKQLSLDQAKKFSWDRSAEIIMNEYRKMI